MATVDDVAAAVVAEHGSAMSTMKLQKLVYYCQAWHLVWHDEPMFAERIEAWAGGPVIRALYRHHRGSYSVTSWPHGDPDQLRKRETRTVHRVMESYGSLSGRQLSFLTHRELPWRTARAGLAPGERGDREITTEMLYDYYASIAADDDAVAIHDLPELGGEPR